jgi:hypothetical protein
MGLLVINVDHLATHLLGPYGNSSVPTPTLNAWAGRGLTADSVFQSGIGDTAPGVRPLRDFYRAADLWLSPGQEGQSQWPLGSTESLEEPNLSLVPFPKAKRLARTWEETCIAKYLELALSRWTETSLPPNAIVWLDLPLLSGPWDAPLEWRQYLAGDDDPEVYSELEPPYLVHPGHANSGLHGEDVFDPDLRMGYEHAAGAMTMLLDHACEWLQNCIAALPGGRTTSILLTAETGFSLGEHLGIGSFPDRTWAEETQVPVLLFVGEAGKYPVRVPTIHSQREILARWWQPFTERRSAFTAVPPNVDYDRLVEQSLIGEPWLKHDSSDRDLHRVVVSRSPNQISIRTQLWSFVWKVGYSPQLFVRPDDRFEQNDVASRCPELIANIQWFLPELLRSFAVEGAQRIPDYLYGPWCHVCQAMDQDGNSPTQSTWSQRLADLQNFNLLPLERLPEIIWAEVT